MCVKSHPDGATIRVRIIPRSSENTIAGTRGEGVAVKVTAPPVEGRANKSLLKFLAKTLGVPPTSLSILKGESSRDKLVLAADLTADEVRMKLGL